MSATFKYVRKIVFDKQGFGYLVDRDAHRLRRIRPDGLIEHWAGFTNGTAGLGTGVGDSASFSFPSDVTFSVDGTKLVTTELTYW